MDFGMKKWAGKGIFGLLMAVLLCLSIAGPAQAEYDSDHPELLESSDLSCTAALLINADTGEKIFEKSADIRMYPASTTKIMTVLVALEMAGNDMDVLQQKCYVTPNAVNLAEDESSARLRAGDEVPLIDLLYAAMLPSGNDAANAIAENLGGTAAFVQSMNNKARSLGCTDTNFTNPHGLHDEYHYTTAADMALIARAAMQNEIFQEIVSTSKYAMSDRSRSYENRNDFLNPDKGERYYPYGTGIKTGTTSAAGNCFVGSASKQGINLISVVFSASSDAKRYSDTIMLMEYGFTQYNSTSIAQLYMENPRVVDIARFDLDDPEVGRLELQLQATPSSAAAKPIVLSNEEKAEWHQQFYNRTVIEFTRDLVAPIDAGEVMGTLTYYQETGEVIIYELVASRSIAARVSNILSLEEIIAAAQNDPNPFPRITFELVLLYLILPGLALFLMIRGMKSLLHSTKRKTKTKTKVIKPKERYYR